MGLELEQAAENLFGQILCHFQDLSFHPRYSVQGGQIPQCSFFSSVILFNS